VTTPAAPLPDDLASAHAPDLILALHDTLADAEAARIVAESEAKMQQG